MRVVVRVYRVLSRSLLHYTLDKSTALLYRAVFALDNLHISTTPSIFPHSQSSKLEMVDAFIHSLLDETN